MIVNEHQLRISQKKLKKLRQAFLQLEKKYTRLEDFEFYSMGVREHIKQIEEEIKKYSESSS